MTDPTLPPEEIADLRRKLETATGGVWDTHWGGTINQPPMLHIHRAGTAMMPGGSKAGENARLTASAVTALPSLLRMAEERAKLVAALEPLAARIQKMLESGDECGGEYGCICGYAAAVGEHEHAAAVLREVRDA